MVIQLKDNFKSYKWIITFSLVAFLISILSAILFPRGILLLPLLSVSLILLYLAEEGKRPIFSIIASLVPVLVDFLINGIYSISCLTAVVVALLVYLFLKKSLLSKGELALLLTVIVALAIGVMIILMAMYEIVEFDFGHALEYLEVIAEKSKDAFIKSFEESMASLPVKPEPELEEMFSTEMIGLVFDTYIKMFISVVVVFAFFLVGLTFKLFGLFSNKMLNDSDALQNWRFELSPIFSYFYVALYLGAFFLGSEDIIGISLLNLLNIFTFVFAYLGFVFVHRLLRMRFTNKFWPTFILIMAVITLYSLALNLLSVVGAFAMIMIAKKKNDVNS